MASPNASRVVDQPGADPSESPATWSSSSRIVQRACLACSNRRRRRLAILVHQVRRLAVHHRRVALVLVARHLRQVPPRRRNRGHRSHSGHCPSWSQQRRGMRRRLANKQSPKPPFVSPSNTDTPQRLPRRWHRRRLHRRARDQPQPACRCPVHRDTDDGPCTDHERRAVIAKAASTIPRSFRSTARGGS